MHRRVRRRGVGAALLAAAERSALSAGKTLLVLDTVTGSDAERLYARQGWQRCGQIPNYALWPNGTPVRPRFFSSYCATEVAAHSSIDLAVFDLDNVLVAYRPERPPIGTKISYGSILSFH